MQARQHFGVALRIVGADQPNESPRIEYLGEPAIGEAALMQSFRQRAEAAKRARLGRNGTDGPCEMIPRSNGPGPGGWIADYFMRSVGESLAKRLHIQPTIRGLAWSCSC